MDLHNLLLITFKSVSGLIFAFVCLFVISKIYFFKLIKRLVLVDYKVVVFNDLNVEFYGIEIGKYQNRRIYLNNVHQTKSYWLPFFAFVTEFDPNKIHDSFLARVLEKRTSGKKMYMIDNMKGIRTVYIEK